MVKQSAYFTICLLFLKFQVNGKVCVCTSRRVSDTNLVATKSGRNRRNDVKIKLREFGLKSASVSRPLGLLALVVLGFCNVARISR